MEDVRAKYNALLAKPPPKGAPCKSMKTFLLCSALIIFLLIIMIVVSVETNKKLLPQTETCQEIYGNDPDAGPVGCRVCQQGARSNDISGLPFVNLGLKGVSHNLGVYTLVRVNGSQITPTFKADQLLNDLMAVRGGSTPDDPGNYVQALGLYLVFAIVMCVITTIAGCSICICKMCCNCACCGRRYPTEKSTYLGFQYFPETNTFHYSSLGVWNTRIFMGTFAFFLALWLGLGQVNGNLGMTSAMKALTHAPDGLVSVVRGLVHPVAQLLEDLIAQTFVGLFRDLNSTITNEVNLAVIIDGVECILDLLGGFPTSGPLRMFVGDLEGALFNLSLLLSTRVPPALANLTGELDLKQLKVTELRDSVNGAYADQLRSLIGNLSVLQDQTDEFNVFTGQMLDPQCCATKANNDLNMLQESQNDISEAEYDFMILHLTRVRDNDLGNVANPDLLISELNETHSVMASLPNFTDSANQLDQHNLIVQTAIADNVAGNLAIAINETNQFLTGIQGFTDSLNATVQNLIAEVGDISLDPIREVILDFNRSSYDLPSFAVVFMFIDSVLGIKDRLFPCMLDVSEQLKFFDRNVAELPQQFLEIDNIISSVNETFEPALETIEDVKTRQRDLEESRDKFNITKQLDEITETERELKNYTDQVSNSNYLQSVRDAEDKSQLNITILPQVERVDASLPTWILPEENVTDIRVLETPRSELAQDLPVIKRDLALIFGTCSGDYTRPCESAADCDSPQTCSSRANRCSDNGDPCAHDYECTISQYCLADYDRLDRTITNLYLMKAAVYSPSSMSGISQLLKDARNASEIDTSSLEEGILEANNSLSAVETGTLTADLNNVISSLNDFNASDFSTQIDEINATLNDFDFNSILENLNSLDDNFQSINDAKESLDVAHQFLNATRDLFFTRLPIVIEGFSVAKLREVRRTSGVSGTLQYLAERVDAETAWLDSAAGSVLLNNESSGGSFATNFTSALAPYKEMVHTICDSDSSTYGSAYFLAQLAGAFQGAPMQGIFTPDGTENKVDTNNAGQPYPGGASCITTTCLENTIDWINSAPLSEVSGGLLPVTLSRQEVIGLPYLVPLFIMIAATVSTLLFCKSSTTGWFSSCLATCTCYGAFCCMPLIFLFVGMAFPLVIVSGDICYSVENIGYNVLSQQGPEMCNSFSGSGPITNCAIPWSFRNETNNVTVNILGTYAGLVAPGCDPNSGAIYDAFEQAKDVFGKMPSILIANFINNNTNASNGLPINFRWPIKQIFVNAADDLSIHTRTFGTGLQRALSCSQLYTIYSSFKGAFCCDVVSAFYWALGSWYLIAWTLLCCGCCAGLLGRKRFAYELWGDEYVQLRDKAFVARDVGDDEPQGKRLSENGHRDSVDGSPADEFVAAPQPAFVAAPQPAFVAAPQPALNPEPDYVPPPTYQPTYDTPAPAYDSSGMESKGDVEMQLVSAPTTKTVEDF